MEPIDIFQSLEEILTARVPQEEQMRQVHELQAHLVLFAAEEPRQLPPLTRWDLLKAFWRGRL